jgi:hypothetical protein
MHAAPAVTVSVDRGGATWAVLAGLSVLAVLTCAAWAWQVGSLWAGAVLVAVAGAAGIALLSWTREPMRRLQWDGQGWWLGSTDSAEPPQPGQLAVAIDLEGWLLLRFRPDGYAFPRRARWLALGRSQHRLEWHALRCAVYSPRPAGPAPR